MFVSISKNLKFLTYGLILFLLLIQAYKLNMHSYIFTTLGISFLLILQALTKPFQKLKFTLVEKLLTLFIILFNLSFLFKATPHGFKELITFNLGFLIYFIFANLSKFNIQSRLHLILARIASVAFLLVGILQIDSGMYARIAPFFLGEQAYSNYPNAFAAFLLIFIPFYLLQFKWEEKKTLLDKILVSSNLVLFLLSWSRAGLISLAVFIGMIAAYFLINRKTFPKIFKIGLVSVLIIFISSLLAMQINQLSPYAYEPSERLQSQEISSKNSLIERFDFYEGAQKIIAQRPLFGFGSGSFQYIYPRFQPKLLANSEHPHNLFLKLGSENGMPTAIVFGLFLIAAWILGLKHFTQIKEAERSSYFLIFASLSAFLLHNLLDYNLNFIGLSMALFALLGLSQNYQIFHNSEFSTKPDFYLSKKPLHAFHLVQIYLALILFVVSALQAISYYHIKQVEGGSDSTRSHELAQLAPFKMQYAELSKQPSYLAKYPDYWPVQFANAQYAQALSLNPKNNLEIYYEFYKNNPEKIDTDIINVSELLKEYLQLLQLNTHQTVASQNPMFAIKLAELFQLEKLSFALLDAYRNEIQKFNDRFKVQLLPVIN